MRAILMKLSSHIKRECFLCRELGEACGAGEMCHDPYDVIYPHQDELIIRCPSCHHPFHKSCYRKFRKCLSCREQSELTMEDSSLSSEKSCEHDTVEFASQITSTESVRRNDSLASTPASASENKSSARKGFLANFLGSIDARSREQEKDILNMNPLSSSLDL